MSRTFHSAWKWVFVSLLIASSAAGQTSSVELKVAAVQFRSSFDIHDNTKRMSEALARLAAENVQVAVFPECALTGYRVGADMPTPESAIATAEEELQQTCRNKKISAVFGSVYKINGHAYDTAVVVNSRGEMVERYGKVYLAGEKWAVPGNHIAFFELEGIPSTVLICHDERYPELVRLPALAGARVVYYVSSESSLKEESKLAPYRAQMMARAVENSVYVVAANAPANNDLTGSHGQSRIIARDGNVVQEASIFGDETLISIIKPTPGTPSWQTKMLNGPLADWWRSGIDQMMHNQHKKLE